VSVWWYLIVAGLEVVLGAFHDLDCHVGRVLEILGEPDGREMAPAQFLDEDVPVGENFAHVAGVVSSWQMQYPSMT